MKKVYCKGEGVQLKGSQVTETSYYVYLGLSMSVHEERYERRAG